MLKDRKSFKMRGYYIAMNFQGDARTNKLVVKLGYGLGVLVFAAVMYFVLSFTGHIPSDWNYFHTLGIAIVLVTVSKLVGKAIE